MKTRLAILYIVFNSILTINGQTINRVEVDGIILSTTNEVEAVTVFNKSSNIGTITDEKGVFVLDVALNDIIEISALQFQTVTVTIDEAVIKSKQLKIQLIEQVNQLDAVMLSYGLSGNLETDIENVKFVKIKPIDLGNMNAFNMVEDKAFDKSVIQDHLQATLNPDARNYLPDLVKIIKLFKKPKSNKSVYDDLNDVKQNHESKNLLDVYSHSDISKAFAIPLEHVEGFMAFIDNEGIPVELLKPENELLLFEFLLIQKDHFQNIQDAKN